MLDNLERVFLRAKRSKWLNKQLSIDDYKFTTVARRFVLPASGSISNQPIDFPSGAIILQVNVSATKQGVAAETSRGGLDMVRIGLDLPSDDGTLTQGGNVSAACLFGRDGTKQWPRKEVIMTKQGSINVALDNLTTSILDVDLGIDVLTPRGAG